MKTDTRGLKGVAGVVSISRNRVANGERICDYCTARPFCSLAAVDTCEHFLPTLSFRPPLEGFEANFSTLRLGSAWHSRLQPGKLIGLWDLAESKTFGLAHVARTKTATLDEMIRKHGHTNHTMLGVKKKDVYDSLWAVIISMYGKNWSAPDRLATTIFCERVPDADALRIEAAWPVGRKHLIGRGREA